MFELACSQELLLKGKKFNGNRVQHVELSKGS